jgi:hypothetical protein
LRLERLFRFVPPAAYLPVTGAGSPRGLSPSGFLQAFTAGQPDRLPAGLAAELLERSFRQPAVDLAGRPVFQAFRIDENAAAVTADRADQLYLLFVSRSLDGPSSRDGVTHAFEDAWNAYRGLIRRRIFLPMGSTSAEVAARVSISAAVRDVTDLANRHAARAAAFTLDNPAALEAFRQLHGIQRDLSGLLDSEIAGVPDTQSRRPFGQALTRLLDQQLSHGEPGLLPAVNAGDLLATVRAQDEINRFVGSWSGEGVAVGPFSLQHLASPEGTVLVPGRAEPFPHRFTLFNGTDRRLVFHLEAGTVAPSGDWQGSTTLHRATNGTEVSEIELPSGGQAVLEARVRAPEDAEVDETAVLSLTAQIGPPNDRTQQMSFTLDIAAEQGEPVLRRVEFASIAQRPTLDTENAPPNAVLTYAFNLTYTAAEGPSQADFNFIVELANPLQGWTVAIETPSAPADNPAPGIFQRQISLTAGVMRQVQVLVRTPNARGTEATFSVRAESVGLEPAFSGAHPESFHIRVPAVI